MVEAKFLKPDTLALHAGQHPDPVTGARAVPIYQTTSFVFRDVDHAASLFNLEVGGHIYSRISNPTVAVFEERVAALEEGSGALGVSSGQAALHIAIATLMGAGGHIVASTSLYGGTRNMLGLTLPRFGITTTFVNPRDHDGFAKAIRPETRLVLGETVGNPGGEILDIPVIADIAHQAKIPLMIDNTFASPVLCRPLTLGADIVFHSATKFIGGHGVAIGGVIVESGRFDWEGSAKFPTLTEPYAGYHGIDFAEEFGPHAFIMRARTEGVRDFGSCMAPQTAFYLLQGLETLPLRMARHVENARKVIGFLKDNPAVERIASPELPDHPDHALGQKLLPKGTGSIFSFDIKGGREAGRRFIERLRLFSHLANVGDAKSLVIHPASTTHAQLDAAALKEAGIGEGMIRLSVGLEDPADLLDDLGQALARGGEGLTMKLTVNGRAVSATTGGTDFDPAKPAVIFLHGAGFDRTVWRLQTRWFAHHGRSVLAVDFPAHGWSDGPALENIAAMADWTAALVDAAGLKQAALVGHSMGALVAVETAARFPDKVRALGLCGVAAEMPVHPEMLESAKANTLKVQELMTFWGMGNALHKGGMVSPGLWLRRESLAVLSGNQPGVIHADLAACNVYKDALARAAAIKCPTVLVLGDGDLMTPAAKAKPLAAAIAGARTVVIPNSGHFMIVERPDETLEALKSSV